MTNNAGYTESKTYPNNESREATIENIDPRLAKKQFVLHKTGAGCPYVSDENVESIREVFIRSPLKAT
jgi:hypothetical protein